MTQIDGITNLYLLIIGIEQIISLYFVGVTSFLLFFLAYQSLTPTTSWSFLLYVRDMSEEIEVDASAHPRSAPMLNERILSSMSRRAVAAHPWHDLEIGNNIMVTPNN